MSSILDGADEGIIKEPLIMTICGEAGSGKTSLASTFPNPYIIRSQGEALPRDLEQRPKGLAPAGGKLAKKGDATVWDETELFDQLMALLRDEHDFKTLIIDSITGFEDLFVKNILDVQPAKQKTMNAAGNGYASEWETVKGKHGRIRNAAELLRSRKGMHVIFIAHVDVADIDLPDSEPFNKYVLQLHKKTSPLYINNVDVIGFLRQDTFVKDDGKAVTSNGRSLNVVMSPSNVSKNRLGIKSDLKFEIGVNPFADYI